ncbi:tetratricopeptide repeat protein [Pelomonas sp. SE-A7]|uniref:tetratricopeptide repeat protein n=1 Tax=Pelomonas sp. SE-A7 TaxID=3054953 RepID=UPI00259CD827|nr:tetratricopeptide repeat protein [Pelomonas sp. SE-A7]MDM4765713.1 tetratricopeptide repeat protein [Pelomonas sp. SE-A7]
MSQSWRPARLIALLALALPLLVQAVAPLDEAQALWHAGKRDQAIAAVERLVSQSPNEAKPRFALAVMRMELGQMELAAKLFTTLTQDFPDLADPFNNLAVILAGRGDLDGARQALEQAVRLQPDHALAQENLGDVLLRLAARAYEQAAKLTSPNQAQAAMKLNRSRELIASNARNAAR